MSAPVTWRLRGSIEMWNWKRRLRWSCRVAHRQRRRGDATGIRPAAVGLGGRLGLHTAAAVRCLASDGEGCSTCGSAPWSSRWRPFASRKDDDDETTIAAALPRPAALVTARLLGTGVGQRDGAVGHAGARACS
jgi:hypothetical protein